MDINKVYQGNNLDILRTFPDNSINSCITSPPYYGLRDYGTGTWVGGDPNCPHRRINKVSEKTSTGHAQEELKGNVGDAIYKTICPVCGAVREDLQVGLEETPEQYIDRLVGIFREVRRVLTDDGILWINIGDTYWGSGGGRGSNYHDSRTDVVQSGNKGFNDMKYAPVLTKAHEDLKNKDLIGIPWMLAFALRKDGWYLRQDIIWHKPNPMPESVKDRFTKSHEYIFMLTKSARYYFDYDSVQELTDNGTRNKRDVWSIIPSHYKEAHFATFPEELVYTMLVASCPKDGIVLDPFMGSGTVGVVAKQNHRKYIGCELNPEYVEMSERRLKGVTPSLF